MDDGDVPERIRQRIEDDYDAMFGVGAYRWAERRAAERLSLAQEAAIAEVQRVLRYGASK